MTDKTLKGLEDVNKSAEDILEEELNEKAVEELEKELDEARDFGSAPFDEDDEEEPIEENET